MKWYLNENIPKNPNESQAILVIGNVQSGKTNFMIEETKKALNNDYDIVMILGGSNNLLLEQSYYRFIKELRKTNYPVHDIKGGPLERVSDNYKGIIISLKHKDSIAKLIQTSKSLVDKKILIFDDESDFGGINIGKGSESLIFKKLRTLYSSLKNGTYVAVTATPYADLLSSDGYDFKQIVKLTPRPGYKGVKEFNNSSSYIELHNYMELRNGKNTNELLSMLCDHIKRVLTIGLNASQFLINPSLIGNVHKTFLDNFMKLFVLLNNPVMMDIFFKDYKKEEVFKIIDNMKSNIYVLNKNKHEWNSNVHSIIIGGALVSRGYTFNNLVTCLLLNAPNEISSCDTLLQRARWFGYRDNIDLIKVYMAPHVIKAYKEAEILNDIIFESVNKEEILEKIISNEWLYIKPSGKVKNGN